MNMKSFLQKLLLVLLLLLLLVPSSFAADGTLTFLSLNDIHGRIYSEKDVGGLAKAATLVEQLRADDLGNVFLVQAGDIGEGPLFFYFHGKAEMTGLNALRTDVGVLGNHEFDLGKDVLFEAVGYAEFPIVVSNLRFKDGTSAPFPEYTIKTAANGLKIAFFGLLTPGLAYTTKGSDEFRAGQDLPAEAERMVTILSKEKPDVIVLLSHCGIEADRLIAKNTAGIHAIIGGHSHTLMEQGELIEGPNGWVTLIGQAGSYARHLGVMELTLTEGAVSKESTWRAETLDESIKEDERAASLLEPYRKELAESLSTPLANQPDDMDSRKEFIRSSETNLGNFIADAFRWKSGAQVSIMHGGGIRGDQLYPAGMVSYATVTNMMPFGNTLYAGTISGKELLQVMETSASALIGAKDEYDATMRTSTGGFLQISGMRVVIDTSKQPLLIDNNGIVRTEGRRVTKLEILQPDGTFTPVEPEKKYTMAATDWTAGGGDKYTVLKNNGSFASLEQFILETTAEYIRFLNEMRAEVDGRITILR